MRKERGITLVSLVVTIIVIIILAGVSINLVVGENGIITKAKQAKEKTEQAKLNEEIALNELYMQMESENFSSISQEGATATADKILKDYKAYSNGKLITGTMANNGAVTKSLNAGGSYTIPAGYHNGSGKVTANSLASQTQATATASDIADGKTAYVNGQLITGVTNFGNLSNCVVAAVGMHQNQNSSRYICLDDTHFKCNYTTLTNDNSNASIQIEILKSCTIEMYITSYHQGNSNKAIFRYNGSDEITITATTGTPTFKTYQATQGDIFTLSVPKVASSFCTCTLIMFAK